MRAAVLTQYDKQKINLEIKEVSIPIPKENEVLVKIYSAAVNPLDNMIIRGEVKLIVPYKMPLVMGNEFSGVVEKVGTSVTRFNTGDRVYGRMPLSKIGAFAEYAAIDENALAIVPEYLTHDEAATVPLTALTAMQAFEIMNVKAGESIFISGGTGSLGAMAIPLAKSLGLSVYTNGSADNEERVKTLGVDRFIDYKKENYADVLSNVDYVLDTLGDIELPNEFKVLKEGGKLVSLRGLPNERFAKRAGLSFLKQLLFKVAGGKYDKIAGLKNQTYDFLFVHEDGKQLEQIGKLFSADNPLDTSIDTVFTLEQVNKALEKVKNGRSKGKTIIRITDE